jgi:hypothetical protein
MLKNQGIMTVCGPEADVERDLAPVFDDQDSARLCRVVEMRRLFRPNPHLSAPHAP